MGAEDTLGLPLRLATNRSEWSLLTCASEAAIGSVALQQQPEPCALALLDQRLHVSVERPTFASDPLTVAIN